MYREVFITMKYIEELCNSKIHRGHINVQMYSGILMKMKPMRMFNEAKI